MKSDEATGNVKWVLIVGALFLISAFMCYDELAYQLSGEKHFLEKAEAVWRFTQKHILDHVGGEWVWGVQANHQLMPGQDKAGFWKCPYHNGRACLELLRRLPSLAAVAPAVPATLSPTTGF